VVSITQTCPGAEESRPFVAGTSQRSTGEASFMNSCTARRPLISLAPSLTIDDARDLPAALSLTMPVLLHLTSDER
jgi:hypothetical protein